jgi:hypothetical protein
MADTVLGNAFRNNFGLIAKYDSNLDPIYKGYIDSLEYDMISASYGTNPSAGIIVKTLELNMTEEEKESGLGDTKYSILESALNKFCRKHSVELSIERNNTSIVITVNMSNRFQVIYI